MSIITDPNKCNGCQGLPVPKCVNICPGNLMGINPQTGKSFIRCPEDCWDCMACVKTCPRRALETKLPYQLANYKASLKPTVHPDKIVWHLTDLKGRKEEFVLKTLEV